MWSDSGRNISGPQQSINFGGKSMDSLEITMNAMVITMALLLAKAALAMSVVANDYKLFFRRRAHHAALITLITLFLIVVCAIATIDYAHNDLCVPYQRNYMLITVILIVFPLHVATECVNRAALHGCKFRDGFGEKSLMIGMAALTLAFVSQISYLTLAYLQFAERANFISEFSFIFAWDLVGIAFPLLVMRFKHKKQRLFIAYAGLVLSAFYVPALNLMMK